MSSRDSAKQQSADSADTDRTALPLWDGTHLSGLPWLRELEANEHLLDADVSYFLRTAAVVTSAAKVAVSSPEHSLLLKNNIIVKQNYSSRNPPPDDSFAGLYSAIQDKIEAGEAPFTGEAIKKALPKEVPAALLDSHVLSPDRIMVTDLKLRNVLLSLITSRGRKIHYHVPATYTVWHYSTPPADRRHSAKRWTLYSKPIYPSAVKGPTLTAYEAQPLLPISN